MSKKDQRIESKKRKAAAFLQLVTDKENEDSGCTPEEKVKPENESEASNATPENEDEMAKFRAYVKEKRKASMKNEDSGCTPEKKVKPENESEVPNATPENEDEMAKFRAYVKEKRKASMERPKVFLTLDNISDDDGQPPLFILDLQHLILYGLEGNLASFKPRWCKLLRVAKVSSVVVVVFNGVGQVDYNKYKASFPHLDALFDVSVPLTAPSEYGSTVDQDMFSVPLSVSELIKRKVPVKEAKEIAHDSNPANFHLLDRSQQKRNGVPNDDVFPRTHLLLSSGQMSAENYPLPLESQSEKYKDFVFTCERYEEVTPESPMFAVDCEMCKTVERAHELTWVSVVNEDLKVIYESLVKPHNRITDYFTRYSGVTKNRLKSITTRLTDVQRNLKAILPPDAILCGQSLNSDLKALKMFHPYVIDTSVVYHLSGYNYIKPSLRKLADLFLSKLIQDDVCGHNPSEDAIATMELVKLKLKNGLSYGDVRMGPLIFPDQGEETSDKQTVSVQETNRLNTSKTTEQDEDSSELNHSITNSVSETNSDNSASGDQSAPRREQSVHTGDLSTDEGDPSAPKGDKSAPVTPHSTCDKSNVKDMIERKKHFFQNKGYNVDNSFFDKLKRAGKKGTLVDCQHVLDRYRDDDDTLECVETCGDKDTKSHAKNLVTGKDFVWAQYHSYQELLTCPTDVTDEERLFCLRKMDKRMSKILRKAPQNSLCVVVLTGRTDDETTNNAMAFARIKV